MTTKQKDIEDRHLTGCCCMLPLCVCVSAILERSRSASKQNGVLRDADLSTKSTVMCLILNLFS